MQIFFTRMLSVLLSLVLSFMGLQNHVKDAGNPYSPADEEHALLLNAAVVSDLHTNGWTTHERNVNLLKLFNGVAKSTAPLDAIVLPGDLTETATRKEYAILSYALNAAGLTKNVLPASGNHDVRGVMGVQEYEKNMRNYYAFCGTVGVQTDKPYWSTNIGGFTFIILGSESEEKDSAYLSPVQLLWLDETLNTAEKTDRPVFLICHQPLAHTNGVDTSWPGAGTVGEQSDALEAILKKHTGAGLPIVYISGHLHDDFNAHSFENPHDNFYCLNLPSAQYSGGKGVMLEVYADRILLRTRDFIAGEWLADTYTVALK